MIDFVLNVCSLQHFIFSLCSFSVCLCYFEYLFTTGYLKKERRGKGKIQIRILLNCWLLFQPIFFWVGNDIALFGIREREKESSKLYHYFTTGLHWPKENKNWNRRNFEAQDENQSCFHPTRVWLWVNLL